MGRQARIAVAGGPHHVTQRGYRREDDPLSPLRRPGRRMGWAAWLPDAGPAAREMLRKRMDAGRPCGSPAFVTRLEALLVRTLRPRKRGPRPTIKPPVGINTESGFATSSP